MEQWTLKNCFCLIGVSHNGFSKSPVMTCSFLKSDIFSDMDCFVQVYPKVEGLILAVGQRGMILLVSKLDRCVPKGSCGQYKRTSLLNAYCRSGFNCESIINANCDFSPKVQLLRRNYYYAMIDSVHVTYVLTLLCRCNQRLASCAT